MLTKKAKKQIIMSILDDVYHVSDKEYQEKVWIRGEGTEVNDFGETVCNFFEDTDPLLENYKEFGLTESQYSILKKFRDQFEWFVDEFRFFSDENYLPDDFIETPEWEKIMQLAKQILKEFNYKKSEK